MKIVFHIAGGGSIKVPAAPGQNILELARANGVDIDAPCAGTGVCGKCRVKLVSGEVDGERSRQISDEDWDAGWRLACQSTVCADAELLVPATASAFRSGMKVAAMSKEDRAVFEHELTNMYVAGIDFTAPVFTCTVNMEIPTLDDPEPDCERLLRAMNGLGYKSVSYTLDAVRELPRVLRENNFSASLICGWRGEDVLVYGVRAPGRARACGVAIDVGTTSVAALLCDVESCDVLARAGAGNSQIRYGADVINRIIASNRPGGLEMLRSAVVEDTLNPMLETLAGEAGVELRDIVRVSIAGNTTMEHLLLGVDSDPIRTEPYVPAFFDLKGLTASQIGLKVNGSAEVAIAPNVGSYVGGDISAGVLATTLWAGSDFRLFVDLGTNGELVLGNSELMMCCACSAGPAFEGGEISCGMRATDGAIEEVRINNETREPSFRVIGGVEPMGVCGSGIIDLIAELFRAGVLSANGRLRDGARVRRDEHGTARYVIAETENGEISISDVDIDNFIRAKAAIYSAIDTMLESLGMDPSIIDRVEVAGGIGSGINMDNAIAIGMFPDIERRKYGYVGNTSLTGACAVLLSREAEAKLAEVGRSMTYLELSTYPGYMDKFVAACFLPHTDASLFPSVGGENNGVS